MKLKYIILIFGLVAISLFSCKNGSGGRYLARSGSKVPFLNNKTYPYEKGKKIIRMKLIHSEQLHDTVGIKYFLAKVMLSPDFPDYEYESKLELTVSLNLLRYPESMVRVLYYNYPDSMALSEPADYRIFQYTGVGDGSLKIRNVTNPE